MDAVLCCGLCCAVLCRDPSAYSDVPADTQDMLGGGRVLAAWQGAQVRRAPHQLVMREPDRLEACGQTALWHKLLVEAPVRLLCQVVMDGLPLQRTWTLLTKDAFEKEDTICVSDNVKEW